MELYDILRSLVTNAMIVALLFTLARPKVRNRMLWVAFVAIVALNFAMNAFFYLCADKNAPCADGRSGAADEHCAA